MVLTKEEFADKVIILPFAEFERTIAPAIAKIPYEAIVRATADGCKAHCDAYSAASDVESHFERILKEVESAIAKQLSAIFEWKRDTYNELKTAISDRVTEVFTWKQETYSERSEWLNEKYGDYTGIFQNVLRSIESTISSQLSSMLSWASGTYTNEIRSLTETISDFAKWWTGSTYEIGLGEYALIPNVGEMIKDALGKFWDYIVEKLSNAFDSVVDWAHSIFGKITGWFDTYIYGPLKGVMDWLSNTFEDLLENITEQMDSFGEANALMTLPIDPSKGLEFAVMLSILGAAPQLIGVAAEAIPVLRGTHIDTVTEYVSKNVNPPYSAAMFSESISRCLVILPMGYFYNNMFRPELFPVGDLVNLLIRGFVTEDEAREIYGYGGMRDSYWPLSWIVATTPIAKRDLTGVVEMQDMTVEDVEKAYIDRAYEAPDADKLTRFFYLDQLSIYRDDVEREIMDMFSDGWFTEEDARVSLTDLSFHEKIVEMKVITQIFADIHKYLEKLKDQYVRGYRNGLIVSEIELIEKLEKLGMESSKARWIANVELLWKDPRIDIEAPEKMAVGSRIMTVMEEMMTPTKTSQEIVDERRGDMQALRAELQRVELENAELKRADGEKRLSLARGKYEALMAGVKE